MAKNNSTNWLQVAIAASFLGVASFGVVSFLNTARVRRNDASLNRSFAIRMTTELLLSAMKDAQTGQRGFLLTGDEAFLRPYDAGRQATKDWFDELEALAEGDEPLESRIGVLRQKFARLQRHLDKTIALRRTQSELRVSDEILELVKSGEGKQSLDEAREVAGKILADEARRYAALLHESNQLSYISQSTIVAGNVLALLLIAITGLVAWRDRTRRDLAELRLIKEQDELEAVLDSAIEGIITFGEDATIRLVNPTAARLLQVDPSRVIGRSFLEFVPERLRGSGSFGLAGNDAEEVQPQQRETCLVRADGAEFPAMTTLTSVQSDDLRFTTLFFHDISELEMGKKRQREYAAVMDQLTDAVVICDQSGEVQSCNQRAEVLLCQSKAQLIGCQITDLLNLDPVQWAKERERLFEAHSRVATRAWVSPEGVSRVLEQRWSLILDEHRRPTAILAFLLDVTEQVRDEARQRRDQRLESLGTLTGGIAHDLNNILTPILMSAKLLKRGSKTPDRLIETIVASADRGGKMVHKLLAFAGGDEGNRGLIHLQDILTEIEEILSHTLQKTIDLRVTVSRNLRAVEADGTELTQVIMNLAINARDAMPSGGLIEIEASNFDVDQSRSDRNEYLKIGPHVLITVADNGHGIPKAVIDRVFDPFFTTKPQGKGTGLGLATALGIVRSYGGDINVYSEPDVGTKFSVFLPAAHLTDEPVPRTMDHEAAPGGQGQTVLVVDDEALVLESARELLESSGYHVVGAAGGAEAIRAYASLREEIDVVLLDMMMPEIDGLAVQRAIRKINPEARIVATSGLRRPERDREMETFTGFLAKPYTDEQLLQVIHHALACSRDERVGE